MLVSVQRRSIEHQLNQTALEIDQFHEHLEVQGQDFEENQSCCTSPDVTSCAREQRVSGSAGAHQYREAPQTS